MRRRCGLSLSFQHWQGWNLRTRTWNSSGTTLQVQKLLCQQAARGFVENQCPKCVYDLALLLFSQIEGKTAEMGDSLQGCSVHPFIFFNWTSMFCLLC